MSSHSRIRFLFKLHSYTGLITGIALLLIGISGSILVFSRDLNQLIYEDILEVEPAGTRITLDSGFHLIQSHFPEMNYITYDGLPQDERSAFEFFMMKDGVQYKAFINPYTGELLHHGKRYDYWMDWLLLFHYTFTIHVWGEFAAAIFSLTLIVSIITGAIVYRKYLVKVFTFKVGFRFKNWRTTSSSLHRIVGVWSLVFHVVIAFTAFWMLRHTFTADHFASAPYVATNAPPLQFSIDRKLQEISTTYPEFHPQFLTLPENEGTPAYFYGHTQGVSFFFANYYDEIQATRDSITSNFLHERSAREKFESMMYPVHAGLYGSLLVKIIYCLGGLTPALLSITGFILWWRRS
ncbi:MAG TPA: PepSY-associated TM helix domain-containing protein [Ohtaekwangia sp.]